MVDLECRVVEFRQLDGVAEDEEFGFGWVKRQEVGRHPSGYLRDGRLEVGDGGGKLRR